MKNPEPRRNAIRDWISNPAPGSVLILAWVLTQVLGQLSGPVIWNMNCLLLFKKVIHCLSHLGGFLLLDKVGRFDLNNLYR